MSVVRVIPLRQENFNSQYKQNEDGTIQALATLLAKVTIVFLVFNSCCYFVSSRKQTGLGYEKFPFSVERTQW